MDRLLPQDGGPDTGRLLQDNWIYIQEPDVLVGRMQIFNNWSPYMVCDPGKVWIGLEYFCYETDELWRKSDEEMIALAVEEMGKIGMISATDVRDGTVIRVPKTYPAYFGTYARFDELREYLDGFGNLFLLVWEERYAQVQQSGPLHAHGDDGGGQHPGGRDRQGEHLGGRHEMEYHEEKT